MKNYYYDQHHVYVWNEAFRIEEVEECSPDVYKLANEASVDFRLQDEDYLCVVDMKVESCGICLLYAEDAEKFKFDHVFMSREPKVDDDSKGGQSRDDYEANESDEHGSKASELIMIRAFNPTILSIIIQ
ncbi:hypothetical protein DVH24_010228 [Malus domestica]|uniref:Uncharacterized protein n=1 Tax=Malus domestica TaxID=3750 RepID=A0A498JVC8_MALDO|nr:hypothetical protein DVH24_010228 [Malus domestica]